MRREYLLTLVKGVSCEGQERPLTMLKEHHMHGKHVCPRWKNSNLGRTLSLHLVCTVQRNMHINIIKGTLWSLETEEVHLFYVFDLEARHMRTPALISKLWFSNVPLSQSFIRGRKSHLHSCQTSQERFSRSHQNAGRQHQQINEEAGGREVSIEFNSDSL